MKRSEILKLLKEAGFSFKEGGEHTLVYNAEGKRVSSVPRHAEIKEALARDILHKQCKLPR